jgi:Lon protease-like protein
MPRLPLFPLNTVLFPGALLPLHIFEERYRLMIGHCIEQKAPFGAVLIREGPEVGGDAEPHDVGTAARIARVQRLPDGRMNLITVGDQRFRILALDRSAPYLQGEIEPLASEDAETPEAHDEANRVAALFGEQFRLNMAVTAQWIRQVDLPAEPDRLADFVASHLDLANDTKQELLETLSVPARLARETELLGEMVRSLTERWEEQRRSRFAGAALN